MSRMLCLRFLVALLVLLTPLYAAADDLPLAVVRLPSHGASATVIHTEAGLSYLLGCAHAFEGPYRFKPLRVDVPWDSPPGPAVHVEIVLEAVDYDLDLSLIRIDYGPLPHVVPVPDHDYPYGKDIVSVGYDGMKETATHAPATVLEVIEDTTFTRERPIPGRSGGALLDLDRGFLIGVVQGYELDGDRRGLYVSLPAIVKFLRQQGWN